MTKTITLQSAFWQTTKSLNSEAAPKSSGPTTTKPSALIFKLENYTEALIAPPKFSSIESIVERSETIPSRKEALAEARKRFSERLSDKNQNTIKALRTQKGWSQSELARMLETSQSHVARIERGTENLAFGTCRKLCAALGIDMNALESLILNQQKNLEEKASNE